MQARLSAKGKGAALSSAAGGATAAALAASLSAFSAASAARTSLVATPRSGCLASSGLKPRSGSATRSPRTASRRASDVQGSHMRRCPEGESSLSPRSHGLAKFREGSTCRLPYTTAGIQSLSEFRDQSTLYKSSRVESESARAVPCVQCCGVLHAVRACGVAVHCAGVATRATRRGAADATLEGGAVEAAVCAILPDRDLGPRPIIVRLATVEERCLRSGGLRSGGGGVGHGRPARLLLLGHDLLLGHFQLVPRRGRTRRVLLLVGDIGEHDAPPLVEHGTARTQHLLLLGLARLDLLRGDAALTLALRLSQRRLLRLGAHRPLLEPARGLLPVVVRAPLPLCLLPQRLLHARLVHQQRRALALERGPLRLDRRLLCRQGGVRLGRPRLALLDHGRRGAPLAILARLVTQRHALGALPRLLGGNPGLGADELTHGLGARHPPGAAPLLGKERIVRIDRLPLRALCRARALRHAPLLQRPLVILQRLRGQLRSRGRRRRRRRRRRRLGRREDEAVLRGDRISQAQMPQIRISQLELRRWPVRDDLELGRWPVGDGLAQAAVRGRRPALPRGDRASAGARAAACWASGPLLPRGDGGGDGAALLPAVEPALPEALLLPLLREVVLARGELLELLRRRVLQRGERHDLRHSLRPLHRLGHEG
eukprot:scaffold21281_cov64-Phaeocystis_antarctica.AAC.2